jgi:hypothetical protein
MTISQLFMGVHKCSVTDSVGSGLNFGEIWLSPVIQATWEARAVGWFEVESPQQDN